MVQSGLINITAFESYLEHILPDYEFYQPSADPAMFRRKFELLKEKLEPCISSSSSALDSVVTRR